MYNVDSCFEIGSSHQVCEDFTVHGSFEALGGDILHYGIVADGCSSSMMQGGVRLPINTDTGARLLALIAKQAIKEVIPTIQDIIPTAQGSNLYIALRNSILHKMDIILRQLSFPIPAIDCTLLISIVYKDHYFYTMWGDGVFVQFMNDFTTVRVVEFDSGAPYYLSYELDKERFGLYLDKFGDKKKRITTLSFSSENILMKEPEVEEVPFNSAEMNTGCFPDCPSKQHISIISDGALSFQQPVEGQYEKRILPPEEAIPQLLSLKGVKGNFLGRMMNLTHRWMKKEQINHYDDLAIATIAQLPQPKGEDDATG